MATDTDLPLPEPTPLTAPYWQALEDGHLAFQRCACGHAWLPARAECPRCLGTDWAWTRASGRGRLVSWVVYHVAYHPAFRDRLPYTVGLVELEEGPRLIAGLSDSVDRLTGDAPLRLAIAREGGRAIARFALA